MISQIEIIEKKIQALNRKREKLCAPIDEKINKLVLLRSVIQDGCMHPNRWCDVTPYDRTYTCPDCGKVW